LKFGPGLNVVKSVQTANNPKSTNKCGKTSMVELIQYGLGRQIKSKQKWHFAPIADKLDRMWLEVDLNDRTLTIERSLRELSARARVHEGAYVVGMEDHPADLVGIDDLSNLYLARLDVPRVSVKQNDGSIFPLTFPTLMRAFILHQEDSFGAILDKMLPEQRRADVLGFITRITPLERFTAEEKLGAIQQQVEELRRRTATIEEFLWTHGVRSTLEVRGKTDEARRKLDEAQAARHKLQEDLKVSPREPGEKGRLDQLRTLLLDRKEEMATTERKLAGLRSEERRLSDLIASLRADRQRVTRLRASETILSSVEFEICPRCLLDISDEMRAREHDGRCCLCNRPLRASSDAVPRLAPKAEDIENQLGEAEEVMADVRREKALVEGSAQRLGIERDLLSRKLDAESRAYVSPSVDVLLAHSQEVGALEAELARHEAMLSQAEALDSMKRDLARLESELQTAEQSLRTASNPDQQRLKKLRDLYLAALKSVDFPEVSSVTVNPNTLMPNINRQLYMHVGTALKGLATVCYHLSLLQLSREVDTFFPRMLVIDSPAVGDLNDANHERLLKYLGALQPEQNGETVPLIPDWQIVLTTRRSIPALDKHVIEEVSSPSRMLLR
jgi:hypothetical protein